MVRREIGHVATALELQNGLPFVHAFTPDQRRRNDHVRIAQCLKFLVGNGPLFDASIRVMPNHGTQLENGQKKNNQIPVGFVVPANRNR